MPVTCRAVSGQPGGDYSGIMNPFGVFAKISLFTGALANERVPNDWWIVYVVISSRTQQQQGSEWASVFRAGAINSQRVVHRERTSERCGSMWGGMLVSMYRVRKAIKLREKRVGIGRSDSQ